MKRIAASAVGLLCLLAALRGEGKKGAEVLSAPAPVRYGPAHELAKLADPKITESSGIACSRVNDGVFWTHNDSGDAPRLYAFNREGKSLGTFLITGAEARDWEDIASFKRGKAGFLLVADVGDNAKDRRECALYLVPEPVLRGPVKTPESLKAIMKIRFTYEDGPHNCESMGIDPTESVAYLVEKTDQPQCKVYALPMPKTDSPKPLVAKAVATLKVPTTCAMDISPDGRRAVVLTYGDAYEYTRGAKETWVEAFARQPRSLPMPPRAQGESICYGPDGKSLYLTSERVPTPLFEVPAIEPDTPPRANSAE